ncbi:MAG: hypothetical protein JKY53_07970 [Flavobacteriales bacterium]|nr:hypothetical protein [Flavobacteriales bacterium]
MKSLLTVFIIVSSLFGFAQDRGGCYWLIDFSGFTSECSITSEGWTYCRSYIISDSEPSRIVSEFDDGIMGSCLGDNEVSWTLNDVFLAYQDTIFVTEVGIYSYNAKAETYLISKLAIDSSYFVSYMGDTIFFEEVIVEDTIKIDKPITRIGIVGSNSVKDNIEFEVSTDEYVGQYTLFDSYGTVKEIIDVPANYQETVSLSLAGYKIGMYFIRIVDEGGNSELVKFIKN